MNEREYTLSYIYNLLASGKYKKSHDMIVYLFQVWFEKLGIPRNQMIIRDKISTEFRGKQVDVELDIAIKKDDRLPIILEVIEPDPNWNLENEDVLKKMERMVIKTFAYLLKPSIIFLTDGNLFIIYDERGDLKEKLLLQEIDNKKEEEIREKVIQALR